VGHLVQGLGKLIVQVRHGVNSIPELELMDSSNSGIDYLKNGIGIDKF